MTTTNDDTNMPGNADNRSILRTKSGQGINQGEHASETELSRLSKWNEELLRLSVRNEELREQRDGAFALIEYAGELLGVAPQEHKSAHGFKVLQAIKDLVETNRQLASVKGGAKC